MDLWRMAEVLYVWYNEKASNERDTRSIHDALQSDLLITLWFINVRASSELYIHQLKDAILLCTALLSPLIFVLPQRFTLSPYASRFPPVPFVFPQCLTFFPHASCCTPPPDVLPLPPIVISYAIIPVTILVLAPSLLLSKITLFSLLYSHFLPPFPPPILFYRLFLVKQK